MTTLAGQAENVGGFSARSLNWTSALQFVLLLLVDGLGGWLALSIGGDGNWFFAIAILFTEVGL